MNATEFDPRGARLLQLSLDSVCVSTCNVVPNDTIITRDVVAMAIFVDSDPLSLGNSVKETNNSHLSNHSFDVFFLTKAFDELDFKDSNRPPINKHCFPSAFLEHRNVMLFDTVNILSTTSF